VKINALRSLGFLTLRIGLTCTAKFDTQRAPQAMEPGEWSTNTIEPAHPSG
jgi:hypothetical protein